MHHVRLTVGFFLLWVSTTVAGGFWYENIKHNGINPTISNGKNWTIFRNVRDFGAKGDGVTDDSAAIQRAISTGDSTGNRETGRFGSTGQPAVAYFPAGTYLVKSTIRSAVGTVLMGDPTNLPSIKASADFTGTNLLFGRDQRYSGLVGFYHGVKNLILDSTAVPGSKALTLLEWSVSQNNQLSNVVFNMPIGANKHTGVGTAGLCSGLILNDLKFRGGGIGIALQATQYHLKSIDFKDVATGVKLSSLLQGTGQQLKFENCGVGIDASVSSNGLFNLIDSTATNTSAVVTIGPPGDSSTSRSLILENVQVDSSVPVTVRAGNSAALTGSVERGVTWVRGNVYGVNSFNPLFSPGQKIKTSRPNTLVDTTGAFHVVPPPTYSDVDLSNVINVKDVPGHPVFGDGTADDTANIQAILNNAAGKKVVYFPYGIYLLSDTLLVPNGTRMIGEAWTQLSATGKRFMDIKNPVAMIQVGRPGEVGSAQMSDFVFTVADILPGAVLVEVNMAGLHPGAVGFFNCHFRIGGARGSKTQNACANPENCLAARLSLHLTPTSSSYWENTWSWAADHDLDGGSGTVYPRTAGGFLIEAQHGTWILGAGIEHHVLYQVNIHNASNVFIGLQEGESAYWQGNGNKLLAPDPWRNQLLSSDPTFDWCSPGSAQCRMGLYQRINRSSNLNLYSSGFWNFVAGPSRSACTDDCQENAVLYQTNSKMYVYGLSTINSKNIIVGNDGSNNSVVVAASRAANSGGLHDGFETGVIAAYLAQSA